MLGLKSKELCSCCHHNKTRRKDEQEKPICSDCEIKKRMSGEAVRNCPVDGMSMKKEVLVDGDIIIDRCPSCCGVWLDKNELETIKEKVSDGGGPDFATGLVVGIALD